MTFVTVYRFKILVPESGQFEDFPRMGTRAAIEKMRGRVVEGSAAEVTVSELDEEGLVEPTK